ncbi:MAG TPA: surface-adhesin E family protein [Steroidobacteraceae bacterium]|nr:surface-adhesin E family protein [Steroidobacteraceae bacterium]
MKRFLAASALAGAAVLALAPRPSLAARWQELGWATPAAAGLVYVDLDSIHQEGNYRIARFLTIYATPATNASGIKMDRILQETAFDCDKHRFTFLSTIGYFEGRKVGGSSPNSDWADRFRAVPLDSYSQHAYTVACTSALASHPDLSAAGDSPGTVKLPGPGGSGRPAGAGSKAQPAPPSNQ